MSSYDNFKKYEVKDVKTVEEFHKKYHRHDRFEGRGKEYAQCVINTSYKELEEDGFTIITHHDSNTGQCVAFYK